MTKMAFNQAIENKDGKVRINLEYYHNHSIWGNCKIIWQTVFRSY